MTKLEFPKGFLWGAATSAHQVEGNNHNDWTEWERENAERLSKESGSKYPPENYISGRACDHYNRFREDFDIAKSLNHNVHRFSIEWSRVEPEEGRWDEKEIEHYREVISTLRERQLEPFITLWHWTLPVWVAKQGGWANKKTVGDFARYVNKLVRSEGFVDVKFWIPINEPGTYVGLGYVQGVEPPGIKSLSIGNKAFKNLMQAQREVYKVIHKKLPEAEVGVSHFFTYFMAYKNRPWDYLLVMILDYISNWRFLKFAKNSYDFIGLQYYWPEFINFKLGGQWGFIKRRAYPGWISDTGFSIYPEGIYWLLRKISKKYKKTIYISENGVADARDIHREKFIKEHLKWAHKAISEGVDVRGYFYWSLLDNFEMPRTSGFWPRFGLVEVDYKTMERRIRQSAYYYAKIIKENALEV